MKRLLMALFILIPITTHGETIENVEFLSAYDGDTIRINIKGEIPDVFSKRISVRLAGIDAPELRGNCSLEIEMAHLSRETLSAYLESAEVITLSNVRRDKYFRLLADVYADGVLLSEWLLNQGLAVRYEGLGTRKNWCSHNT